MFEPGDLMLFWGRGWKSRSIELATRGPSHIGIIAETDAGKMLLYESTTLCDLPDEWTGRRFHGVQAHDPELRVATYEGRVRRLRLTTGWSLNRTERALLHRVLGHFHGYHYDLAGALLSGTRLFKWSRLMPYPDLGSLFCSELCAAVLMRLGRMPLANPSAFNPASLVREVRRCGTYGAPEMP